jgi:hypothetical protein
MILNEFLKHLGHQAMDEINLDILTTVFEYFFLTGNNYMCTCRDKETFFHGEECGPVQWELIDNLLTCLQLALERGKVYADWRLVLSLTNLLALGVGPGPTLMFDCESLDTAHPLSVFELQSTPNTDVASNADLGRQNEDVANLLLEYELINLPIMNVRSQKVFQDLVPMAGKLAKITRQLCQQLDMTVLGSLLVSVGTWSNQGILSHLHPAVRSAVYREIFFHASKEIASSDFDSDHLDIQQLLEVLEPVIDSTAAFIRQCELLRCEPMQQLKRAVFIVRERLPGYESKSSFQPLNFKLIKRSRILCHVLDV